MSITTHWHCENGCKKVVFVHVGDGTLACIKCGGRAINLPLCRCCDGLATAPAVILQRSGLK